MPALLRFVLTHGMHACACRYQRCRGSDMHRIAILAEGKLNPQDAKTAVGILRYRPETAVAVIDSAHAGSDAATALGDPSGPGASVPVVADVATALPYQPDTLL